MERRRFTENEKQLIAQKYDCNQATILWLAQKLNRTENSIRQMARSLGITNPAKQAYLPEEIEFLKGLILDELPFRILYNSYVNKAKKAGWPIRSRNSIGSALYRHKELQDAKKESGDFWHLGLIATALKCSTGAIKVWFRDLEYKEILRPSETEGEYYIHPKNLARFCREYPGEIAKHKPDILWLIDLLSNF